MRLDERRKLKALLDRLERAELPGDVGHMVYLALENATDEREQAAAARAKAARRGRGLATRLKRLRDAFDRTLRGG